MTNNNEQKSNSKLMPIVGVLVLVAIIGLMFFFKPYGDQFPFDDFQYSGSKKTSVKFYVKKPGKGRKVAQNDRVFAYVSYRIKKQKTPIFDSKKSNFKITIDIDKSLIKKKGGMPSLMQEACSMIRKNGEVYAIIKAKDLLVGEDGKPDEKAIKRNKMEPETEIVFGLSIEEIKSQEDIQSEVEKAEKDRKMKEEAQKVSDLGAISKYIKEKKLAKKGQVVKLPSGVHYIVTKRKGNRKLKKNQRVVVKYTLKSLEGKLLSKENSEIEFKLQDDKSRIMKGFDEAISKLNLGDSAIVIIPSGMAYGPRGFGRMIEPNTNLYYELEVVSILKPVSA